MMIKFLKRLFGICDHNYNHIKTQIENNNSTYSYQDSYAGFRYKEFRVDYYKCKKCGKIQRFVQ